MNPLDVFQKEAPEVAQAFDGLIEALKSTTGLDAKTKQLVYIGIKSSLGDTTAIYYHVQMAKKLGATREEIRDTNDIDTGFEPIVIVGHAGEHHVASVTASHDHHLGRIQSPIGLYPIQ